MRTKILIVVVALILGAGAAVLAANYLRSARMDIAEQNKPVEVLVAQQDLPRGLAAEELMKQGLVKAEKVPARFVAADAVSSSRVLENQVLATSVGQGEQLTRSRFAFPAAAGLSYTVPADHVALTVEVDDVSGVAGLLRPGDNVVMFTSYEPTGRQTAFTKTAIAKARVLAVGASTSAESGNTSNQQQKQGGVFASSGNEQQQRDSSQYKTVTLALKVSDAQTVSFAQEFGTIQLALLPQNAETPGTPDALTFEDVAPRGLLKAR